MPQPGKQKKVVVIGGGLGGMAAAITCAAHGAEVTLFEKNERVGGKCNTLSTDGFTFDLGPSILLLPEVFRTLFSEAGRDFDSYVKLIPLQVQWRNFFEDGLVLDLLADSEITKKKFEEQIPGSGRQFHLFEKYAINQYEILERIFLSSGADTLQNLLKPRKIRSLLSVDIFRTMHQSVCRHFKDKHLRNIFDFFIKYVGSSAWKAPGFMNLLSGAQLKSGLWYIEGGIYKLAVAMEDLMKELDVKVHLNTEVTRIMTGGSGVRGVITREAEKTEADAVISNMEVIPAYRKLLPVPEDLPEMSRRYEPACSGIVLNLGLDKIYSQLAHHNFFYSADQKKHFKAVFEEYRLPDDPTLYVVAPCRTDPSKAPPGCDVLKVLPHIPHLRNDRLFSKEDYEKYSENILMKLERMGLEDLRKHIVVRDFWTPYDLERRYYSNEGAIYGVVTDRWKNFAFKAPKKSRHYKNLFFTGGSVNPGGGMPMVTLSGLYAGRLAVKV